MGDSDIEVREAAAESLGRIPSSHALNALTSGMKNKDLFVRIASAKALGLMGHPKAISLIIKEMENDNFYARRNATRALGSIGDARAVAPLLDLLEQHLASEGYDPDLAGIVKALGEIGDARAAGPLEDLLASCSTYNNYHLNIIDVAQAFACCATPQAAADTLAGVLTVPGIEKAAAVVLGKIGDKRAVNPLMSLLTTNEALPYYLSQFNVPLSNSR